MSYTISVRNQTICKAYPLSKAIEKLEGFLSNMDENEETRIRVWKEVD